MEYCTLKFKENIGRWWRDILFCTSVAISAIYEQVNRSARDVVKSLGQKAFVSVPSLNSMLNTQNRALGNSAIHFDFLSFNFPTQF